MAPTQPETVVEEDRDFMSRALALRMLEIPVKEFIYEGLSRSEVRALGQDAMTTLLRNTEDEERHDIALGNCVNVFEHYDPKYELEIANFLVELKKHPAHPILKTLVLENAIFFPVLGLFREFGFDSLSRTAADVSADETNHVKSHRQVCLDLKRRLPDSLDVLRKELIYWLTETFEPHRIVSKSGSTILTKDDIREESDNLMYKGVAKKLGFTQKATMNTPFETANNKLQYYK